MWIKTLPLDDFDDADRMVYESFEHEILILHHEKQFYAFDNECPHLNYPLEEGELDPSDMSFMCPWHNWRFDVRHGECITGGKPVHIYKTKIEKGHIWVEII